ncbi:Eco57I restriction-modification methylase domain-containing protein [Hyphobacterium sp.]|uniref:Eco57I restriction-modification methylase domain-containing protein n=1 Tax=Hyphobacterium sp. TaxID=2004662 RepID=UPI003B51D3B2
MGRLADRQPQYVYEGLLSVLLRIVFVLYAEDRDLIPSREDEEAKRIYDQGYSVRDLFARLEEDRAQHPDTMDDRYGAWGRLLGLFRLIHDGSGKSFMHPRRGKLFNPDTFPFLEGRFEEGDTADVLPISDACIHEVLRQLLILNGERLSYKTLDVEQIGSVYETIMGFVVTRTGGQAIALRVKPNAGSPTIPAFVELEELLAKAGKDRKKYLKDTINFDPSDAQNKALKAATDIPGLLASLDRSIDERASPAKLVSPPGTIVLQPTDERRKSGSHYTPRSLTAPIVADALRPIFDQLGDDASPDKVLALKVCDPAMGSGAFLVEACRALGERLEQAWKRHPDLLPDEARHDPHIFARREVAKRCLYGVDKNAMATDLAKLSLWLITLARDEDFSFLDHALKTGDSLVGLPLAQIKRMTWEGDTIRQFMFSTAFDKAVDDALDIRRTIRSAPDNVTFDIQSSRLKTADKALDNIRLAGDAVIGVFFSEKKPKDRETNLKELHESLVLGQTQGWELAREYSRRLRQGEHPINIFHWEIEFPEVFSGSNPGFDAFVGNPPFAGKNTVANSNRDNYTDWLKVISPGAHGNADLVTHFFRRAYAMLRAGGAFGLIATNTIGQGDTRESGLRYLLMEAGGTIYRAQRRVKWPGAAAVVVSTVHTGKGNADWPSPKLDGRPVSRVSAFLREGNEDSTPSILKENEGIAFQGSIILGMGFTFDDVNSAKGKCEPLSTMHNLIEKDPRNAERIKPYLGGEEVNNDPKHKHHRYVIDFEDFPLRRDLELKLWSEASEAERTAMLREGVVPRDYNRPVAADWPELLNILETYVKPSRLTDKREAYRRKWWQFAERRVGLTRASFNQSTVPAMLFTSSIHGVAAVDSSAFYANSLNIFVSIADTGLALLQSRIHEVWARLLSSSLEDRLRYTPTDCFQTFPMPEGFRENAVLEDIADRYLANRAALMTARNEGLTKTYNRFHNPLEGSEDIATLRRLHAEMDDAVLRAYGWEDLAELCAPGAEFEPCFLTEDDEPEFAYQGRLFWPAAFRDKVLARLLDLNKKRAAAERSGRAKTKSAPMLQLETKGSLL